MIPCSAYPLGIALFTEHLYDVEWNYYLNLQKNETNGDIQNKMHNLPKY